MLNCNHNVLNQKRKTKYIETPLSFSFLPHSHFSNSLHSRARLRSSSSGEEEQLEQVKGVKNSRQVDVVFRGFLLSCCFCIHT